MHATRTEEWMEPICELIREGLNVDSRVCAVEGHTTFVVIQKHSKLLGSLV